MKEHKTPDWLIKTQNKSWEPEIIISGIMLTFLFLLSNHIYNFFGMLTQDFGVFDAITRSLYIVSIIMLNGLKIVLIIHLVLRGIWTGFVGLSYVFPEGVKKEKLPKSERDNEHKKPEDFVIQIEKICSLLFSFIFSSVGFLIGLLIAFLPVILLFFTSLSIRIISHTSLVYIALLNVFFISNVIWEMITKKKTRLIKKIETSIIEITIKIYSTNLGKVKTVLIFVLYFSFVYLLSFSTISSFDFNNDDPIGDSLKIELPTLNMNHYNALRDTKLRNSRAALEQFKITDNKLELFISYYKEDIYTIEELQDRPELAQQAGISPDSSAINIPDLYKIFIDDQPITDLQWYITDNLHTNQKGLITTITIDSLANGYHELKLDKLFWRKNKKKIKEIENWDVIPFVKE